MHAVLDLVLDIDERLVQSLRQFPVIRIRTIELFGRSIHFDIQRVLLAIAILLIALHMHGHVCQIMQLSLDLLVMFSRDCVHSRLLFSREITHSNELDDFLLTEFWDFFCHAKMPGKIVYKDCGRNIYNIDGVMGRYEHLWNRRSWKRLHYRTARNMRRDDRQGQRRAAESDGRQGQ